MALGWHQITEAASVAALWLVTLQDVTRMACEIPEGTEGERYGSRTCFVVGEGWDRLFSKADIRRF